MVNSSNKGDHIISIKVTIPKILTSEQKSIYLRLKEISK